MAQKQTNIWNLKEVILDIIECSEKVTEIYLFGSRAHNTCSRRSDIDLLALTETALPDSTLTDWIHEKYPPVDVFLTTDIFSARSIINGSVLNSEQINLVEKLGAVLLWKRGGGFSSLGDETWEQLTDKNVDFKFTLGNYLPNNPEEIINNYLSLLNERKLPNYYLGSNWTEVGYKLSETINIGLDRPSNFQKRAKNFSIGGIKLKNEYDFQNLIHILIRPILPQIEPENTVIKLDGNKKNADFGIFRNSIIIEAKHISDTSTKNTVLKTLEGLASFYSDNPNVKLLLFWVLYESSVKLDTHYLEQRFSKPNNEVPIIVKFYGNKYI